MGESESIFLERHSRVEEGGRREINIQKTGLSGSGTLKRRWKGEGESEEHNRQHRQSPHSPQSSRPQPIQFKGRLLSSAFSL